MYSFYRLYNCCTQVFIIFVSTLALYNYCNNQSFINVETCKQLMTLIKMSEFNYYGTKQVVLNNVLLMDWKRDRTAMDGITNFVDATFEF